MKNDLKRSQASTRRRIAGAAATLSVLVGVVGLESGALAAPSSNAAQVTNATLAAASTPTFSVSAPSITTATVTWTNLTPTMLGRNGVDSSGTGAWNTGTAGVPVPQQWPPRRSPS